MSKAHFFHICTYYGFRSETSVKNRCRLVRIRILNYTVKVFQHLFRTCFSSVVCPMRRVHEGARAIAEGSEARGPGIEPGSAASVAKVQAVTQFGGS